MNRRLTIAGGAMALLFFGWFAYAHLDQNVDLQLALFTLRGVPLPIALYAAIILGMLIMIAVGLRSDSADRRTPQRRRAEPGAASDAKAEGVLEEVDKY